MFDGLGLVVIGVLLIMLLCRLFLRPFRVLENLVVKAGAGLLILLVVNYIGAFVSFSLPVNMLTALTAGMLGIPGVVLLACIRYIAG